WVMKQPVRGNLYPPWRANWPQISRRLRPTPCGKSFGSSFKRKMEDSLEQNYRPSGLALVG
ncbi:MAG TPA: hypothetical protein VKA08_14710, partial [Balneolales bacterium]|nr:hypothetical protein [Balneolales bacterium]